MNGGEPGANDAYLIVRQYDAHAWVEAWLPGGGWVRVDPTAAISPARIESGLRDAVAEEGSFLENSWAAARLHGNLKALRWVTQQLDRMNYQWQRWVVGYQGQSQLELMSRLPGNFGLRELGYVTAGVIGVALLLAGLAAALGQKSASQRDPWRRLMQRWQHWLSLQGVTPRAGDTPGQLAKRQAQRLPDTAEQARAFARQINNHYYGGDCTGEDIARMKRLLRTMRKIAQQSGKQST
ncbi:transglutaminase domain-containing protein [Marinobacter sp. X15-166B]|uniref:DUF4129 domain-containing transglutaminase family protein n=1 Tax=Marinobacter sp. X15-166B TaxID=1897620 RepID=UPI002ADFD811|nr:transglutaminase domain-containing protein [Marinobacter sp. X15-166B]